MSRRQAAIILFLISLSVGAAKSTAQVTTGTPPFGTFGGGPDVVNLGNLNVEILVPIVNKAGRGLPFRYVLPYNGSIWYPVGASGSQLWQTNSGLNLGWGNASDSQVMGNLAYSYLSVANCYSRTYPPRQTGSYEEIGDWVYYDASGTPHPLSAVPLVIWTSGTCSSPAQKLSAYGGATDGSGYQLAVTGNASGVATWTVTDLSGTQFHEDYTTIPYTETVTDRNGNKITVPAGGGGNYTDTLGSTVLTVAGAGTPSSPYTYTYTGPSGSVHYSVRYTAQTVRTNFGCSGISEFGPTTENLVSEIDLPDGSKYTFSYEPTYGYSGDVTGRIQEIALPTGGTITYTYGTGGVNGITCADGSAATLTRTVDPGGNEPSATWTYTHTESGSTWNTTVQDPNGNQTVMTFNGIYRTQEQVYQGTSQNGTLLKTVTTSYGGSPIDQRTTEVQLPLGGVNLESETVTDYNSYGLPTEEDDYGYGSGAVGPLLRKTLTTYDGGDSCGVTNTNVLDRPCTVTVQDGLGNTVSQTTDGYDANGDLTSETSGGLTKSWTYNANGSVATATDVNNQATTYTYGACGPSNNLFPTLITGPTGLTENLTWNCNGAVVTSVKDANGQTTSVTYNDPYFWRPAQTSFPDGGWQAFSYPSLTETDTYTGITNSTPSTSCSTGCREDQAFLDGMGRPYQSILVSDPDGQTTVTTTYDPANAQMEVTNPDRTGASTNGTTTTTYDALGRATTVEQPDGNKAYSYYGSAVSSNGGISSQLCLTSTYGYGFPTLTIDAAGNKRESWTDALGHTIEVDEPNSSNNLTEATCSEYDANGNLLSVAEPLSENRTYQYDELGRATSVTTPESGTTTYTYDTADSSCSSYSSKGDLVERKDANGNVTCYQYDALHRVTSISYSDGSPGMYYTYDTNPSWCQACSSNIEGRLVEAKNQYAGTAGKGTSTLFSYDAMGRVTWAWEQTPAVAPGGYSTNAAYNLDGSLKSLTYPDGSVVNYAYSNAQRPLSAIDSGNSINYAQNATYAADGALASDVHGQVSGGFNGITETWGYNNDLEPTSISAVSSGGNALNLTYSYALPNGNNGTVTGINNGNNANRDETMTYDPLNRILSAQTAAASGQDCWGLNFGSSGLADDAVGNLTSMSASKCTGPSLSFSVNSSNHITNTGFSYDSDGNMTADGTNTYTYNAENEITSAAGATYSYGALGHRVEKQVSGTTTEYIWFDGNTVAEHNPTTGDWTDYVFFAGRRIAWRDASGNVHYMFADALGSTRVVTNSSGSTCFEADYYPYGQENDYNTSCSPTYKFTGYEFDSETGNYYANARYYDPAVGRFLSADPLGGVLGNPQSLNRYSYVINNPESLIDPLGLYYQVCVETEIADATSLDAYATGPESCWREANYNDLESLQGGGFLLAGGRLSGGIDWIDVLSEYSQLVPIGSYQWFPDKTPPGTPTTPRSGGTGGGTPQAPAKKGLFTCTSDAAESVSIAADLHKIPGLKSGAGGFIVDALAGNPFSGGTDLITSLGTGEAGGHNVFYNIALADAAGPSLGFGPAFAALGHPLSGAWAASPTDWAVGGLLGEYATGVGEANLAFSTITYGLSLAGCGLGLIH